MLKAAIKQNFTEREWNANFRKFKRLDGHYSDASDDDSDSNDQKSNIEASKAETIAMQDQSDILYNAEPEAVVNQEFEDMGTFLPQIIPS